MEQATLITLSKIEDERFRVTLGDDMWETSLDDSARFIAAIVDYVARGRGWSNEQLMNRAHMALVRGDVEFPQFTQ